MTKGITILARVDIQELKFGRLGKDREEKYKQSRLDGKRGSSTQAGKARTKDMVKEAIGHERLEIALHNIKI